MRRDRGERGAVLRGVFRQPPLVVVLLAATACTASVSVPVPGQHHPSRADLACRGSAEPTAGQFVDSVGVATHLSYDETPYADEDLVRRLLGDLGVRHIRDGWPAGDQALAARARDLADRGVRLTFVHDPRSGGTVREQHRGVRANLLDAVEAAESLNEPDTGGGDWAGKAIEWTRGLSRAYRDDPRTASVPVLAPAVSQVNDEGDHRALAALKGVVDYGNTHDYPGKSLIMDDMIMDTVLRNQATMVGDVPVIATETGYSDGPADAPYETMSQDVVAVLLPRLFLEHFRRGIARTFAYELLDEGTGRSFEDNFGLVEHDGTPKPSYTSLRNLLGVLGPVKRCDQPPLEWALDGADGTVRSVLLRGGPGQYFLALWRQVQLWDDGRPTPDPALAVRLRISNRVDLIRQYKPSAGDRPARVDVGSEVDVAVSGSVTILDITGVTKAPPSPSPSP